MAPRWYALCSKPHKEGIVWRQLQSYGFEVFFPRYLSKTGNLSLLKIKPYFPGYLFVKIDVEDVGISTFQWMPFAIGLVCFGGKPVHVPDQLVEALRRRIEKENSSVGELMDSLEREKADSLECIYQGYDSIFDTRIGGDERVQVLLQMLHDISVSEEVNSR